MYLSKVKIENIRSISSFEMVFEPQEYAGWHVLIGDNGAGKSTIIRALALAMVGPDEAKALRQNWNEWLKKDCLKGKIEIETWRDKFDRLGVQSPPVKDGLTTAEIHFTKTTSNNGHSPVEMKGNPRDNNKRSPFKYLWSGAQGWFSVAYGPFRRFTGGNTEREKLFYSNPKLAAHLSAFGEDIALTECVDWLVQLNYKRLENLPEGNMLEAISKFINNGKLLPHGAELKKVSSEGVFFRDGNDNEIPVTELSDGYRSILSLLFELIRQLVFCYGQNDVFKQINKSNLVIDLPGVVLIDEIDAHLHPTWQVRIGQWFTKYFPKIQFIVTTHSPLICHAAEKGTVWRLAAPGSHNHTGKITGIDLKRLVYGNVLEAYGTNAFGVGVTRSETSRELKEQLARLNTKSIMGKISEEEEKELEQLKSTLPTS